MNLLNQKKKNKLKKYFKGKIENDKHIFFFFSHNFPVMPTVVGSSEQFWKNLTP